MTVPAERNRGSAKVSIAAWVAITGMVLDAVAILGISAAFVSVVSSLRADPENSFDWLSMTPAFMVAAVYLVIAFGLARRNRVAFVLALLINLWLLLVPIWIGATGNALAQTVIPYALGLSASLVVVGLALAWRDYWRRSPATAE